MSGTATFLIRRGLPGKKPIWARFEVSFEPGQSVLDGLRHIRATKDQSLAFRYSCINANACKECLMSLDGKTVYACTARLEAREMRLEPLANKQLIHDLVTEIAPPDERIANLRKKPSVPPTN